MRYWSAKCDRFPHMPTNLQLSQHTHLVTFPLEGSRTPIDPALWSHPMLALYLEHEVPPTTLKVPIKLFLVPTPDNYPGEEQDTDCAPTPSAKSELPELAVWVERFVISIVEIWGGRRHPMQLARWCHRSVHAQLTRSSGSMKCIPRVRKIYLSEPIEGVCETTVTLRINDRVRSLILRFEGVDKRWLCTELVLL
jgi:hypothetical protein